MEEGGGWSRGEGGERRVLVGEEKDGDWSEELEKQEQGQNRPATKRIRVGEEEPCKIAAAKFVVETALESDNGGDQVEEGMKQRLMGRATAPQLDATRHRHRTRTMWVAAFTLFLTSTEGSMIAMALPGILRSMGLGLEEVAAASGTCNSVRLAPFDIAFTTSPNQLVDQLGNPIAFPPPSHRTIKLLAYVIMLPLFAVISDAVGQKPIILMCLIGRVGSCLMLSSAKSLVMVYVTMMPFGFSLASTVLVRALVAEKLSDDPHTLTRAFGYIFLGAGSGMAAGPLLGGYVAEPAYLPALCAAGCSGLAFMLVLIAVPSKKMASPGGLIRPPRIDWGRSNAIGLILKYAFHRTTRWLLLFHLLVSFTMACTDVGVVVVYTQARFGWGPKEVSHYLVAIVIGTAAWETIGHYLLSKCFSEQAIAKGALSIMVFSLVGAGTASTGLQYYALTSGFMLCGLAAVCFGGLSSQMVPRHEQGAFQACLAECASLVCIPGSVLCGYALSYTINTGTPGAVYFGGSFTAALATVVFACIPWSTTKGPSLLGATPACSSSEPASVMNPPTHPRKLSRRASTLVPAKATMSRRTSSAVLYTPH